MLLSNISLFEFISLPIDGHLGGLQFLAIMNISTVNIIVHGSLEYVFISFGYTLRSVSLDECRFNFIKNCQRYS